MSDEKNIKIRQIQCYDCSKFFPRTELRNMKNGDILICSECLYGRNRRKAVASVRLKKRKII